MDKKEKKIRIFSNTLPAVLGGFVLATSYSDQIEETINTNVDSLVI